MSSVVPNNYIFCENKNTSETNLTYNQIPFQKCLKQIPIKVIFTEEQSTCNTTSTSYTTEDNNHNIYPFSILKSRKKEKKYLRHKFNTIISRVHNMDCLLKKIKAKFLKYIYITVKKNFLNQGINIKKFDQSKEVRNLNVIHNRNNFINLKIVDILLSNNIINKNDLFKINDSIDNDFNNILNTKVKLFYQFNFLSSSYFKNWLKDPIKISKRENKIEEDKKFPNHSKFLFTKNPEDYKKYKLLLLHTACNFIFYFQNNPLKFGKKNIGNNNNEDL